MKKAIAAIAITMAFCAMAEDAEKFDPRMALKSAVVDTNGVSWIDGRYLPIEGRAFDNTTAYYDRLPANVTTNVNSGVRGMKNHTAGMQFRFTTTSPFITCMWSPTSKRLCSDNVVQIAMSGIDIYTQHEDGKWYWQRTGRIRDGKNGAWPTGVVDRVYIKPNTPILINLPLYNGIRHFALGIKDKAEIRALPPRKSGVTKSVVFYGTSITHGASASRPGLAFVNIIGRDLDVPVVNLGFSGSGKMEMEMSEHLAAIDASCYVLDCLWNMSDQLVEERYEPFIRNLRKLRPEVPIVMAGQSGVYCNGRGSRERFVEKLYKKLVAEGWKKLSYLPNDEMYPKNGEGSIDGSHPNDLGMAYHAKAYGGAVKAVLGL